MTIHNNFALFSAAILASTLFFAACSDDSSSAPEEKTSHEEETSHEGKRKILLQHGLQTNILGNEKGNWPGKNRQKGRKDRTHGKGRCQPHGEHPVHPPVILVAESGGDQEGGAHQEDGARQHEDIDKGQGQDDDGHGIGPDELAGHHAVYGAVELDDDARKDGRGQVMPQGMANDMRVSDGLHLA